MSLFDQTDDDKLDDTKSYLEQLVGEGKKFKTIEDLAKGKIEADRFIEHKNKEFDEIREDLLKVRAENIAKDKLEELLAKRNLPTDTTVTDTAPVEKSLRPEDLDGLLEQKLSQREMQKIEKANLDKVEKRLEEQFGHNASKVLKDKLTSLNMSYEDLKFLAKRSPDAVFNTLNLNQPRDISQSPPRGSLRTDSFSPQTDIPDALFYEKMRQTDPKKYYSEKVSIQRLKDMDRPDFLTRYNQQA
jgi:hypothetical protein